MIVLTPRLVNTVEQARELSVAERDLIDLLPREVRESELMGNLRLAPQAPATQPQEDISLDKRSLRLFDPPPEPRED